MALASALTITGTLAMRTLIISIHAPFQYNWQPIQLHFIKKSIGQYDYGIVLNGPNTSDYSDIIYHFPEAASHRQGIAAAMDYFKSRKVEFDNFLLLDSDCFPVRPDWAGVLDRLLSNEYLYAAPIRTENFDSFPHPSAVFMRREFLDMANFGFERSLNMLGVEVSDVGTAMPQVVGDRQAWYPLVKTNQLAPHPVYGSIYGDLFYHHCAGSRGPGFRANGQRSYDHVIDRRFHRKIYKYLTKCLFEAPDRLVAELRGTEKPRLLGFSRADFGAVEKNGI